ncbi:MAG: class III poly(R)-hydroxyalkanoic acid synthase subunit PhaC, partial [Halovenus sp.]
MNPTPLTGPIDAHRQTLELAAEIVEKTDIGIDRLETILAADVGETESEVIYDENKLTLHRYEPPTVEHGTPIFIVYALVNRPYILDLQPDRSVVRRLLEAGF